MAACTFYNLMKQAFQQSKCDTGREQRNLTFEQWREQIELLYPQFQFCSITLNSISLCYSCAQFDLESLVSMYIPSVSFYHRNLSSITITMPGGCPFITTTWRCYRKEILLSFTNLRLTGTLLYLEPKLFSLSCS